MAKRISTTAINWGAVIEKFAPEDRVKLTALKVGVDKFLREIAVRPAELPKIDWNAYKNKISTPGMVESFQKAYESLKVPYPTDQGLIADAEKYNALHLKKSDEIFAATEEKIVKFSKQLEEKEKMMPYGDMTIEEFLLANPDIKEKYFDQPRIWPYYLYGEEFQKDGEKKEMH